MSEELLQRNLLSSPEKIGNWYFYNIGSTSIKTLKEKNIIRNINYGNIENKKVDALITQDKNVIAVIEYKIPSKFKTLKQKKNAIKQELAVAKKLCNLLIVTDTKETIWINALNGQIIKDENGFELNYNFDPNDKNIIKLINKIKESIDEIDSKLKAIEYKSPTELAKQIWQDIWSVSGATPENCLYTFVELFIFKYLSDLNILKGAYSFDNLVEQYNTNDPEEVLEHYADVYRKKIKDYFPANPIDNTTIINGTIFVSKDDKAVKGYSTVFRKILLRFKNYGKLENIDHDFKSQLFESFLKESISKKNWGQFFTPLKVVRAIINMVDIKEGMEICDPACGVGKFLLEPFLNQLYRFIEIKNNEIIQKVKIIGYDKGFDKEEQKTIILAKANMLIYLSELMKEHSHLTENFSQLFNVSFLLKTNSILGTLSDPVNNKFDLILTNPPYVTSGSSNLKEEIKKSKLEYHYKINALGVEGLFMEWIIRALKPDGKAFIVIPDGILTRQNDQNLRQFILNECFLDAIISLPIKTFFTSLKKTYILAITKKPKKKSENDEQINQTDPVFTYLVSNIGETLDIYRFEIEENNLIDAVNLFNQFKGSKKYFKTNNKRCKIQPIDHFEPDEHWAVDRWWTKEEKIELGIIEEEQSLSISELGNLIGNISNTFSEYQDLLNETVEENEFKNIQYKEIELNNNKYFELFIGKRLLKKDIKDIKGNMPIYSANVFNPVGFHNFSNIEDFNNNFVLWGIDGDFEFNIIKKGYKFVTTDHCGSIRIKTENILPEYLLYQLNEIKHIYGFDRGLRASLKNMQKVIIKIPIDKDGNFDIDIQEKIAAKYNLINQIKKEIKNELDKISNIKIDLN